MSTNRFAVLSTMAAGFILAACSPGADVTSPSNTGLPAPSAAGSVATGADIQISGSASTGSPLAFGSENYTYQIKNSGPQDAGAVTFTDTLSAGVAPNSIVFVSNGVRQWCPTIIQANPVVSCDIGGIAKGAQVTLTLSVIVPGSAGTFTSRANATSTTVDPQPANNAVTVAAQVKVGVPALSSVVAYSNFSDNPPVASGNGYAVVGLQATGFFSTSAEQFTAVASGTISSIRLPVHQYDTGGSPGITLEIHADNPNAPGTIGALIASYSAQSIRTDDPNQGLTTISIANGAQLVAGTNYWIQLVPAAQTRETWSGSTSSGIGLHFYADTNGSSYSTTSQAAFEIRLAQ